MSAPHPPHFQDLLTEPLADFDDQSQASGQP